MTNLTRQIFFKKNFFAKILTPKLWKYARGEGKVAVWIWIFRVERRNNSLDYGGKLFLWRLEDLPASFRFF